MQVEIDNTHATNSQNHVNITVQLIVLGDFNDAIINSMDAVN
jgi:hypothetical protein